MTKEINDIINAFKAAELQGRRTALATVVHVEGSSYRRPGARMLVEDNGKITGAISGAFQHIGILSLEFHVDKLSRPLL